MYEKHSRVTATRLRTYSITWGHEQSLKVCLNLLSFGVREEVIRPDIFAEHHIVIEVNELLGESWDAVDVGLNGWGAESRKMAFILEDILEDQEKTHVKNTNHSGIDVDNNVKQGYAYQMCDDCNSGVVQVEPGRNLPICHNEDVPHPGCVSLYRPQRIPELLVVLKSTG